MRQQRSVVGRYLILHESEHLFASKYRLVLPSEDELRQELGRDREELEAFKRITNQGDDA